MKIICISDTHGAHSYINVPDGDILIHAGDFSSYGREEEVKAFINWFKKLPHKHKVFVAGNHDVTFEREPEKVKEWLGDLEGIHYLNDSGVTIEGIKIWGSPIQPFFGAIWAFGKQVTEIQETWDKIPDNTDILITHGPPHGIFDTHVSGKLLGCPKLLNTITRIKPRINVFGHIHEGGGSVKDKDGTIFINAAVLNEHYVLSNGAVVIEGYPTLTPTP